MGKQLTDAVPQDDDEIEEAAAEAGDDAGTQAATDDGASTDDGAAQAGEQDAEALAAVAGDDDAEGNGETDDSAAAETRAAHRIPKDRFDEVNEARKQAQQENAQLRQLLQQVIAKQDAPAAAPAPKPRDFDAEFKALQDRYDAGDLDDAGLRVAERKLGVEQAKAELAAEYEPKLQALQREREAEQQQRVQEAWASEVAAAIKAYPFLDHEGDSPNRKAIDAVRAECEELMQAGIPAPKALRLAVRDVAPQFGDATPAKPEDVAATRKAAARKALADAENRQPSRMSGVGNGVGTQGKQRLTASVKDHDKWEHVPEPQREQAFTA